MNNRIRLISIIVSGFFLLVYLFLLIVYLPNESDSIAVSKSVAVLSSVTMTVDGESQQVSLPYESTELEPGTVVTLSAYFTPPDDCYFYIEAEYTAFSVYINKELIYSFDEEYYPEFMQDPPSSSQIFELDNTDEKVSLEIDYIVPTTVSPFVIEPILLGSYRSIFDLLCQTDGFAFIFGLMLLIVGVILIIITGVIILFERQGVIFLWLGLSSLTVGAWLFCDSNLAGVFITNYTQLLFQSLCGMVLFPIPLIYFGLVTVKFHHRFPLMLTALVEVLCAMAGLLLLFTGVVSPAMLQAVFHILVPLCICVFAGYILFEDIYYQNESAKRYTIAAVTFAIFTVLEVINNRTGFANMPISFFQIGVAVFIISMGVLAAIYIRDTIALQKQNQKLEHSLSLMEYQADMIKKSSLHIMDNVDDLRKQRHDLRHQLMVIRKLASSDDRAKLSEYIDSLIGNIPQSSRTYCDNVVVNAILSHYASICARQSIAFSANVRIDKESDTIPDTDYCIVFGNILENAVEACAHVPPEDRFIRISNYMRYSTLIITVDNSYDGQFKMKHNKYVSRKRADFGVGLNSVQVVAKKHGGDAKFKGKDKTFMSSVYFTIE